MEDLMAVEIESQVAESKVIFEKPDHPITLKFVDLTCKVKVHVPIGWNYFKKGKPNKFDKEIFRGLSGIVKPGEMLAMLGPSGSGKTTLLTALGGRLGSGCLTGTITYNNNPFSNRLKRTIGFVTQDDVHHAYLTVKETLTYTALLRLPNTMSKEQKIRQAELVISQLRLKKCKDTMIGGPFLRGISGGERRRVSIGQELLINPSLLLLDEPTSGLDSTTSQIILSTMSDLAKGGRTVIVTIHQPSTRLFYMFDKVMLLSDGNPLYFGKGSSEVLDYFKGVGFAPSLHMNPADFLLDLSNGISSDYSIEDQFVVSPILLSAYKTHLENQLRLECEDSNSHFMTTKASDKEEVRWVTTWLQQVSTLLQRERKTKKHESFSIFRVSQVMFVALLSGLLWWKSKDPQQQVGILFFCSVFWTMFPAFHAKFTFPLEKAILAKERSSGMYRLSSYFIARAAIDLQMELLLPTSFFTIVYFMAGLKASPRAFFGGLFSVLLLTLTSQGLGLAIGALIFDQRSANAFASSLMLTFQLVVGFYVQIIPSFISWIKYLSCIQYSFKLLLESQYNKGETYPCGSGMCFVEDIDTVRYVGLSGHLFDALMLLLFLVMYRIIAYVALMRIGIPSNQNKEEGLDLRLSIFHLLVFWQIVIIVDRDAIHTNLVQTLRERLSYYLRGLPRSYC